MLDHRLRHVIYCSLFIMPERINVDSTRFHKPEIEIFFLNEVVHIPESN